MSAGEGHVSQFLKFKPSFGDFPPTFHVPTNILHTKPHPQILNHLIQSQKHSTNFLPK